MKKRMITVILIVLPLMIFPGVFFGMAGTGANAGQGTSYEVRVLEQGPSEILLRFELHGYDLKEQLVNSELCTAVWFKGGVYPVKPGVPALPFTAKSIIIPDNAGAAAEIVESETKRVKVKRVAPSRGAFKPGKTMDRASYGFGGVYEQNREYPGERVRLGRPYILRDYRGAVVYFHPFSYHPVKGELTVAESITVKIKFSGVSGLNTIKAIKGTGKNGKNRKIARVFDRVYSGHFLNYSSGGGVPVKDGGLDHTLSYPALSGAGNMLVITTEDYRAAVEPLVAWKNRKGIKTELAIYPGDTGNGRVALKEYIQGKYDAAGGLVYILIVGDCQDVPPSRGTVANAVGFPSDPNYVLLEGDDYYADAMIGRFSVSNLEEARTVVNKNLWYEMTPDEGGEWYGRVVGIACDDRYFTPNPIELIEEVAQMLLGFHYTEYTRIYDPLMDAAQVTEAVNRGCGLICAYYHGTRYGWVRWTGVMEGVFVREDVERLTNRRMTPFIIAKSCSIGSFENYTCFAEKWQRLGTPDEPMGCIAITAGSSALWNFTWVAGREMIDHMVNERYHTAGELMFNGVMRMVEFFPDPPHYEGPETFQLWHLFGDPSLLVYTAPPVKMAVEHNKILINTAGSFHVRVALENGEPVHRALAALYMNGTLYGSAFTDEAGNAVVSYTAVPPGSGKMEVNVTAVNTVPYFGTVDLREGKKNNRIQEIKAD